MLRKKPFFDVRIARELGLKKKTVAKVTQAFLAEIVEALTDLDEVSLVGFGLLHVGVLTRQVGLKVNKLKTKKQIRTLVVRQFRVHMQKSTTFKNMLRAKHGSNTEE